MPVKTVNRQQSQTPAQQLQLQQQRDVENGLYPTIPPERRSPPARPPTLRQDTIDMEEIPLNQTNSQEPEDRRKMREIFDKVQWQTWKIGGTVEIPRKLHRMHNCNYKKNKKNSRPPLTRHTQTNLKHVRFA